MMELDRDMLLQAFAEQATEGLAAMEESLLALEARPGDAELLNTIFRTCHTLKGDAAILELPVLTEFAHVLEDLLDGLRADTLLASTEIVSLLLRAVDAVREMVEDAVDGRSRKRRKHQALLRELSQQSADPTTRESTEQAAEGDAEVEDLGISERLRALERVATIRVRVDTLDRLLNLTGELAIGRSRLTQLFVADQTAGNSELAEAHQALDPLFVDLQHEVLQLRMIPVGTLFRRHLRTVRDLAVQLDKNARLEIEGEDAELDTTVIEQLRDPLAHMVRNAIAHGIESPVERESRGKDPCGRVVLRA
ncbi:MAG: Hpt domain-containing protein, partial [Myxococcales bacterium]|nr:Hpt domain-containing protein [Myxococcales bacterium]